MDPTHASGRLRIDRRRIREAHQARLAEWPRERTPLTIRSTVRVVESHRKSARVGPFTIESDEGAIVGGDGSAPTPLGYFVSAVGLAVLTDLVRAFALFDLPLDDLGLEIEADFPLDAKYGDAPLGVAASEVRYTVDVRSEVPLEAVQRAVAWAERYCHAVHSLREPVRVEARYLLNGGSLPAAE